MTRARTLNLFPALAMGVFLMAAVFAAPARGQTGDPIVAQARAAGQVGEQADGYLGYVPGADISAEVRSHVDQINIRRRTLYTNRAAERNVSVNEMAAAVACEVFSSRIGLGERYRDQSGQWRRHTESQPVLMPSFCPS
jgi:uncharacterized protein YdbL (DUF1318 family)